MSFANLKRNRTDFSKLVEAAQSAGGAQERSNVDDRFWVPTRDKAGNGYAVIRFLPGKSESGTPWVRYWDHAFKGPTGQWYIEKSLTSIDRPDPLSELNSKMWNNDNPKAPENNIVRQRKRNLRYVANILVISDPAAPENEGKVKLYRFGKKVFEKLMKSMKPLFPDEKPVNPFDMWTGADFSLKIQVVDGYPNYDSSSFREASPLLGGDDEKLEKIYESQHDISEFVDPAKYKTYDELKARLSIVLGDSAPRTTQERATLDTQAAPAPIKQAPAPSIPAAEDTPLEEEDDMMSYFTKLAQD
jgi:hypothetical protein